MKNAVQISGYHRNQHCIANGKDLKIVQRKESNDLNLENTKEKKRMKKRREIERIEIRLETLYKNNQLAQITAKKHPYSLKTRKT